MRGRVSACMRVSFRVRACACAGVRVRAWARVSERARQCEGVYALELSCACVCVRRRAGRIKFCLIGVT